MEPTTNHFTVFLVLSTTFITCGANQKFVCPKAELIKPCYCEPATNGLISVNCFLSETWLSLKQSLRSLKKGKFAIGALKVRGLRDSSNKPHRIFTGLNIEELIIEDCSLPKNRLPGSIFHRASVIYLTVRNCLLTSVPTRALKPLKQLIYLDLSDNKISRLNNDSLKFVNSTLKYLGIANNSIAEFPSTLLKHLPNLEVLDVRQNQLLEIPSDAFIQNSKLSMLNLNSNLIREIDPTAFDPCPQLKFLGISSNDLNGSFSALEVLSHLEALEISDVQVDLKSFLPSNSTLTTLVLQNSRVHNGHVLSHFTNLKELDISDNRESFGNDSFLSLNAKAVFHNVVRLDIR